MPNFSLSQFLGVLAQDLPPFLIFRKQETGIGLATMILSKIALGKKFEHVRFYSAVLIVRLGRLS
jgi:hypothetical protein